MSEEPQSKSFSDGTLNFTYPASWETFKSENAQSAFTKEPGISKDVIVYVGNSTHGFAVAKVTARSGYYLKDAETVKNQMAKNEGVTSAEIRSVAGRNAAVVTATDATTRTTFIYIKLSRTSGYAFMYEAPLSDTATLESLLSGVRIT
ncbi:hypothetical protein DNK57_01330 [Methanothermobacter thermautotrophicus]|uniref:PsbP C-terminal domain-containing protein n=1 Tax=Methanothermobacter thermautotrophicus TaxID=145262 RepID=A0A842YMU5_METTF|nr:hypothetical protein [Methanothermobacter thermautotrophicus]